MLTILVIDDESPLRDNLIEFLEIVDFNVVEAQDKIAGIEAAITHQLDLIICDLMVPQFIGYEVLKTLRTEPTTANTSFILLSAVAEKNAIKTGISLGADAYLTKPFSIHELLQVIKHQLEM
ncbi:MAG TPA: response regulator [Oculatellaceae cyanobacterium]|jgi:chemotaxis family two-component system response regulator PixG